MSEPFSDYVGTHFEVAIWWPKEGGYGGLETFKTRPDANAKVDSLKKLGYGSPKPTLDNKSEIHMRQVSQQIVRIL